MTKPNGDLWIAMDILSKIDRPKRHVDREAERPFQLIVHGIVIDKIPIFLLRHPHCIVDKKYSATRNGTNDQGYAISIALDTKELPI